MYKLIIILLLSTLQLSAKPDSTLEKVFYFKMQSKGTSRVEKIFSTDSVFLQKQDRAIVQLFEGWFKSTAIEKFKNEVVCEGKIEILRYELYNEEEQDLVLPFKKQELEQIFYYTISSGRKILNISFQAATTIPARKIIKELLSHLQFSYKANKGKSWEVLEDDPIGHGTVSYQIIGRERNNVSLKRTVLNYFTTKREVSNTFLSSSYVPEGDVIIELRNNNSLLFRVSGSQKVITKLSNKIAGVAEQSIYLVDSLFSNISDDFLEIKYRLYQKMKKNVESTPMYSYVSPQQILIENRRITLGNDNFETIVAMLSTAGNVGSDSLYFKLRALCTVYPDYSKRFTSILDTALASSAVYENIWQALLHTGNAESVNAICSILIHHKNDWPWLKNIIGNLGLVKNGTDTLRLSFQQLYAESNNANIKNTLELAMGTMVDNLSITDKNKSTLLYKWLLKKLDKKPITIKNDIQRILVLGNTNRLDAKAIIKQYLNSTNEDVRRVALHKMENIQTKQ